SLSIVRLSSPSVTVTPVSGRLARTGARPAIVRRREVLTGCKPNPDFLLIFRKGPMLLAHVTTVPNPDVRLGHYHLLSLLGEGGMGAVYLAEDTKLGRMGAVKTLPLNSNEEAKRRFIREARAVAALDHPNICPSHALADAHGPSYV